MRSRIGRLIQEKQSPDYRQWAGKLCRNSQARSVFFSFLFFSVVLFGVVFICCFVFFGVLVFCSFLLWCCFFFLPYFVGFQLFGLIVAQEGHINPHSPISQVSKKSGWLVSKEIGRVRFFSCCVSFPRLIKTCNKVYKFWWSEENEICFTLPGFIT